MSTAGSATGQARGTVGPERLRGASRALGLIIGALALASCGGSASPTVALPHLTAAAACLDSLGAGWTMAVEADRPDSATLAFVSGDSIATCQTWAAVAATPSFGGNTVTGIGKHPLASPPTLSYLTGGGGGDKTSFLVGRVPPSASAVRLTLADGPQQSAVLGDGVWLAWLEQPSEATAIEALDPSGKVLSRLADPNGLQPAG